MKFFFLLIAMNSFAKDIIVAVIDTGADQNHPAIAPHLWKNPGEIPENGLDDDGNGKIDDVYGWNFADDSSDITDNHGHGTHISGLITSSGNKKIRIMILKYYQPGAPRDAVTASLLAIEYAVQMKVDIINYSAGGNRPDARELAAIRRAERAGVVVVAAAGNEGQNADKVPFFPASYPLSNVISVAAVDTQNQLLSSSNWGISSVFIAAPGKSLFSALPGNRWGPLSGTSQATAVVTAEIANWISQFVDKPDISEIREQLARTTLKTAELKGKNSTGGVLSPRKMQHSRNTNFSQGGRRVSTKNKRFALSSAEIFN
ncbi:MAG: S8 family serine peptidase [Bdellovibrionaceae bacterium]|nr:S8 family serine peptidase [Pseudobdellovibrionaceae bacterium]